MSISREEGRPATKPVRKTASEIRATQRDISKMNALQGTPDEQNNVLHSKVARKKERDRLRMERKRAGLASTKVVPMEALYSKEGIEQTIRACFAAAYPEAKMAKHLTKFFRFVHVIILEHHRKQTIDEDYQEIKGTVLGAHVTFNKPFTYKLVSDLLETWGVIEVDHEWSVSPARFEALGAPQKLLGEKTGALVARCKGYRVGATFQGAQLTFTMAPKTASREVANQELREKLVKLQQRNVDPLVVNQDAPHIQWLRKCLGQVTLNQQTAFAEIDFLVKSGFKLRDKRVKKDGRYEMETGRVVTEAIGQLYKEDVLLFNKNQEMGTVEGRLSETNGRFNSGFTRLYTCGRAHTQVNGVDTRLVALDLGASQPYMSIHLFRNHTAVGRANPQAFDAMIADLSTGKFYEKAGGATAARDQDIPKDAEAKTAFYRNLIFSKSHRNTPYRQAFAERHPLYVQALMEYVTRGHKVNEKGTLVPDYKNLAVELQRVESELFLQQMLPRLHQELGDEGFLLTVHDSFYCLPQDVATVRRVMTEVLLAHTGITPTIKQDDTVVIDVPAMTEQPATITTPEEFFAVLRPRPFRAPVPQPRATVTAYTSYEDLPDHWKAALAGGPTPPLAVPALPHYALG